MGARRVHVDKLYLFCLYFSLIFRAPDLRFSSPGTVKYSRAIPSQLLDKLGEEDAFYSYFRRRRIWSRLMPILLCVQHQVVNSVTV